MAGHSRVQPSTMVNIRSSWSRQDCSTTKVSPPLVLYRSDSDEAFPGDFLTGCFREGHLPLICFCKQSASQAVVPLTRAQDVASAQDVVKCPACEFKGSADDFTMHFALQHGTEGRRRRKIQVPIGCVAAKNKQKTTAANPRLDSNSPRVPKSTARLSSGYTVSRSLDLQIHQRARFSGASPWRRCIDCRRQPDKSYFRSLSHALLRSIFH